MYYIDFDNTLFNTHSYGIELLSNLYEKVLENKIPNSQDVEKISIIYLPKNQKQISKIVPTMNYYFLKAKELSKKYNIPYEILENALKEILSKDTFKYKSLLEKYNISYETLDNILFEKFTNSITNEALAQKYNIPTDVLTDELINATKQDTSNYTKILEKLYETAIQYVLPKNQTHLINDSQNSNSTIANFFLIAKNLSNRYDIPYEILEQNLINTMKNDSKFIFPEALDLLKNIKKTGEKICILTHVAQKESIDSNNTFLQSNLAQQAFKLLGSEEIFDYVDEIYITSLPKYTLDLDYEHNSFIDDSPDDLGGLFISQHPDICTPESLNLQYINFQDLYNKKNCNSQIMNKIILKIAEKKSLSYEEIINQCPFNLDNPNFDIIIDCLSAKFGIKKQELYDILYSSLRSISYNTDTINQSNNQEANNILASYSTKNSNIKSQLLTTIYSSVLPQAKGIFISNRTYDEIEQDKNNSKTPGKIFRFKGKYDHKRISRKVKSTKRMQLLYTNGKMLSDSEEIIPVYTSLLDIPLNEEPEPNFKKI